jgi:GT2 family glycosyltransferase
MTTATRSDRLVRPRHVVTAVLVAHDGARWLPTTLYAVKTQRRPVQRFVAVDTGSHDDTAELLGRAVGASSVISAPRTTGFSAAAHLAVAAFAGAPGLASTRSDAGAPVEWIWLLHDDSAPSASALEYLLELADEMPSAGVIGPKLLGWADHRVLLEVGVTADRGGRRETGLEPGELDHGQHDGDRDVMAVSTAGMLVRRDVWESLGGLDRALPLFRDDLDFGWRANLAAHRVVVCSRAVVYHAEAAASGARRIDNATPFRRRLDRASALRTMLVNASRAWFAWVALRLTIATLLRAVALLVLKRPLDAWDELRALGAIAVRPHALIVARRARKRLRKVPARDVRKLLAPRGTRLRHYADALSARLAAVGATDDQAVDQRGLLRRIVSQPGVLLVLALVVVALVAERHVLGGTLYGGALLPAPAGASDLWHTYTQSWHPTGFGSDVVAPPYLGFLAMFATVLFGSAQFAVQILVLGAVPLAGLAAYIAVRPIAPNTRVRIWVAATYALLPVVTGAVSSGRLGVLVVAILLPFVLSTAAHALVPPLQPRALVTRSAFRRAGRRWQGARPAWAAAIPFTVAAAFDPIVFVLLGPLMLVALIVGIGRRSWLAVRRAVVILVVPPALLLPWTIRVWHHPALIVTGIGRSATDLAAPRLSSLDILLLHPGGPGTPPLWLYVVVVLAGLAGLLQLTRPRPAQLGWLVATAGLIGGLVISQLRVHVPGGPTQVPGWSGEGTGVFGWPGTKPTVMGAGILMSAAVAGARLRARLAATSFGWRQPVALTTAALAIATPVAAGALWLARGTGSVLHAGNPEVLPAFIMDPATSHDGPRTVVLRPQLSSSGKATAVTYSLARDRSPQLGDADLPPDPSQVALVDTAVADLSAGLGDQAAVELAHAGVRYVLVPLAGDGGLGARIASAGGLLPKVTASGWQVWQVDADAGRLMVATPGDSNNAGDSTSSADAGPWQRPNLPVTGARIGHHATPISFPYAPTPRLLVLAEAPSPHWRASTVNSNGTLAVPLQATTHDGMQAFVVPTAGGNVVVYRAPDRRANWLIYELIAALVVLGGAIPAGQRAADQQRHLRARVDEIPAFDSESQREGVTR